MRSRTWKIVLIAALVVAPFILGYAWWRHHFPYGWSRCCDLDLFFALHDYAIRHAGDFPTGEATPEASLSLLYRTKLADANLLRGKTMPQSVVRDILEHGELLTPDTCGWHYVEGLHMDDDRHLAILWDKASLDQNGGLLEGGGHIVMFLDGDTKHIPEAQWDAFIAEQRKLLAENATALRTTLRADNHVVRVQLRVRGDDICGSANWNDGGSSGGMDSSFATVKKNWVSGPPFIPIEEIRNARVVVEQENARVRFVLKGREIIYDQSGFHVEAIPSAATKK